MRRVACLLSAVLLAVGLVSVTSPAQASAPTTSKVASGAHAAVLPPDDLYGKFHPVGLTRVLDTRAGVGSAQVPAGATIQFPVAGVGGLPAVHVAAVAVDVAVLSPAQSGTIAVFPGGTTWNGSATMTVIAGQTAQGNLTANLGSDGTLSIRNNLKVPLDLIGDVAGYYNVDLGTPANVGAYDPLPAQPRIVDTHTAPIPAGATRDVHGVDGLAAGPIAAVVVNLTVIAPAKAGSIAIYSPLQGWDGAATMTLAAGQTQQRMAVVPLTNGAFTIRNNLGSGLTMLIDVVGYFAAAPIFDDRGAFSLYPGMVRYDTRTNGHAAISPGGTIYVYGSRKATIAAQLDVMVVRPSVRGSISVFPGTSTWTGAATVSFTAGVVTEQPVTVGLGVDRGIRIRNNSTASIDVVIEQIGAFAAAATPEGNVTQPLTDPGHGRPTGMSCPTSTFCALVTTNGFVSMYDGATWGAATRLYPLSIDSSDGNNDGGEISCASARFCVVPSLTGGGLVTFNGKTWSADLPTGGEDYSVTSVSCPTETFCLAVGSGNGALRWDGSSWADTSFGAVTLSGLERVSCVSATSCLVVADAKTAIWNGTTWTATPVAPAVSRVTSLDCAAISYCVAVGAASDSARWNGTGWTPLTGAGRGKVSCPTSSQCLMTATSGSVDQVLALSAGSTSWSAMASPITGTDPVISCASASNCVVASKPPSAIDAFHWNGISWSDPETVDVGYGVLRGVSCAAIGHCVAVDANDWYFVYGQAGWSSAAHLPTGIEASSISCLSLTFCMVVGSLGQFAIYDGSTWSGAASVGPGSSLTSVSCASVTSCFALDRSGSVFGWDGSRWTSQTRLPGGAFMSSVSCAGPTFCAAFTTDGRASVWDGQAWHAPATTGLVNGRGLVSCSSATYCLARSDFPSRLPAQTGPQSGPYFGASVWDGSTWTPIPTGPNDIDGVPVCGAGGRCLMASVRLSGWNGSEWTDDNGEQWYRTGFGPVSASCVGANFCAILNGDANGAIITLTW